MNEKKTNDNYILPQVSSRLYLKNQEPLYSDSPMDSPKSAVDTLKTAMSELDREYFAVVNLDATLRPINFNIVSIGNIDSTPVSAQQVFKTAILSNAANIMVFHNHPSGIVQPSRDDLDVTRKLIEAGNILDVPVIDHIIIGGGNSDTFSFHENGLMESLNKEVKQIYVHDSHAKNISNKDSLNNKRYELTDAKQLIAQYLNSTYTYNEYINLDSNVFDNLSNISCGYAYIYDSLDIDQVEHKLNISIDLKNTRLIHDIDGIQIVKQYSNLNDFIENYLDHLNYEDMFCLDNNEWKQIRRDLASPDIKDIIKRCENNETVSLKEIYQTPELIKAQKQLDICKENFVNKLNKITGKNITAANKSLYNKIDTTFLPIEIRIERRNKALKQLNKIRSAVVNGEKTLYNGDIKRDGRLDIVIGLPASGKSSALVDLISEQYKSRIIDNDEAKKCLPEYNNGYGAGLVHEESSQIADIQFQRAAKNRENLVIPKVGGRQKSILNIIMTAKANGYSHIGIHYVDVPKNKAMGRLLGRLVSDYRFLKPELINDNCNDIDGNQIAQVYELLKNGGEVYGINEYSKWSNDVKFGEPAILLENGRIGQVREVGNVYKGRDTHNGDRTNYHVSEEKPVLSESYRRSADLSSGRILPGAGRIYGAKVNENTVKYGSKSERISLKEMLHVNLDKVQKLNEFKPESKQKQSQKDDISI